MSPTAIVISLLATVTGILISALLTVLIARISGIRDDINDICLDLKAYRKDMETKMDTKADKSTTERLWDRVHHHKHNGDGRVIIMEGS